MPQEVPGGAPCFFMLWVGAGLLRNSVSETLTAPGIALTLRRRTKGFSVVCGVTMPFDRIMPAVVDGTADAGVIIHEGRFTYREHGLVCLADLGRWWEDETGYPIPLGK